jgi:signal transduction histidine kinase
MFSIVCIVVIACWLLSLLGLMFYVSHGAKNAGGDELNSIGNRLLASAPGRLVENYIREGQKKEASKAGAGSANVDHNWKQSIDWNNGVLGFQAWSDGRLLFHSPDAPLDPWSLGFESGVTTVQRDGAEWQVYAASDSTGNFHLQLAKPGSIVHDRLLGIFTAMPLNTLQLLIVGLLMWWAFRASLRPLTAMAEILRQRDPFDATTISTSSVPTEIRPLIEAFNALLKRVDSAVQAERQFIADAAHELRTPLAALHAQAEVALRAPTSEQKHAALMKLLAVSQRSTRLSEQLLDLARLDAGLHGNAGQRVELSALVFHVASEFEIAAERYGARIILDTGPCQIECDVDEIGILIRNLVDNALRYGGENGQVKMRCGYVQRGDRQHAFLEVADSGLGVPEEQREAIFKRFHRVPGSGIRGSGIGLSLVAAIAGLHGASIEVSDGLEGRGLCVRVLFAA